MGAGMHAHVRVPVAHVPSCAAVPASSLLWHRLQLNDEVFWVMAVVVPAPDLSKNLQSSWHVLDQM